MADETSGVSETAFRTVDFIREWAPDYILVPALVSQIRLRQRETEQAADALEEFERVAKERSLPVLSLATDPDFDPLREDERFTAVVDEIGVR